ncbi:unnamed protein product, partial [Ectocarpus fasciculatus]
RNNGGDWQDRNMGGMMSGQMGGGGGGGNRGGGGGGYKRPRSPEPVAMDLEEDSPSPPRGRGQEFLKQDFRGNNNYADSRNHRPGWDGRSTPPGDPSSRYAMEGGGSGSGNHARHQHQHQQGMHPLANGPGGGGGAGSGGAWGQQQNPPRHNNHHHQYRHSPGPPGAGGGSSSSSGMGRLGRTTGHPP